VKQEQGRPRGDVIFGSKGKKKMGQFDTVPKKRGHMGMNPRTKWNRGLSLGKKGKTKKKKRGQARR